MADLLTHIASALIPGVGFRRPIHAVLLSVGTALPDLGGRVPGILAEVLFAAGVQTPSWLPVPFGISHQPVGGVLIGALLAYLLPERERPAAAAALCGGVLLHLALDVLQDHHGYGYYLLVPFDFGRYELGCIGSEATVAWAPWLALASVLVWGVRGLIAWRRLRVGRSPRGPGPRPG